MSNALAPSLLWMIPLAIGLETPQLHASVMFVLGIGGGITALIYREIVLAIATAFWGSLLLVYSVFGLVGALVIGKFLASPAEMMPPLLELWTLGFVRALLPIVVFALTILGTVFQIRQATRG